MCLSINFELKQRVGGGTIVLFVLVCFLDRVILVGKTASIIKLKV